MFPRSIFSLRPVHAQAELLSKRRFESRVRSNHLDVIAAKAEIALKSQRKNIENVSTALFRQV
jgi:hypothetical protein